jgi:membrane associated rhomboid family serine protease
MLALLIPTGSDHDRNRWPVVTLSLIVLNLVIHLATTLTNHEALVKQFGFVAAHPRWYQFITHMFLHAGLPRPPETDMLSYFLCLLHIGGNMAYLWFAGSDLEDVLGPVKFLALYIIGGIASALLFWATAVAGRFPNLDEPAIGASGAVSALLGFYVLRFPLFKIRLWFGAIIPFPLILRQGITRISSLVFIGFWIGLQLFLGIQALKAGGAQVAYWGHIGGFLFGFAAALVTRQWRSGREEYLLKEAEAQFAKQNWYPAMERYRRLAERYPRCVTAVSRWAVCWECLGFPQRAEKVLTDALTAYRDRGWTTEAALIESEIESLRRAEKPTGTPATSAAPAHPNVLFRRQFKWKDQKP